MHKYNTIHSLKKNPIITHPPLRSRTEYRFVLSSVLDIILKGLTH